jgi:hypothetical protein
MERKGDIMRSHPSEREEIWIHGLPGRWGEVIRFRPTGQKEEIEIPLNAGSDDRVRLFRSKGFKFTEDWYLVLSKNERLQYCGLQVIHYNEKESRWEDYEEMAQFVQDESVELFFGPRGLDLEDHNLARALVRATNPEDE